MSDDNIDNDRKNIFNEVMLTKCNENMIIIETRKRYYAWCEVQKQTIEMLSIMIKQVLLKYEAQEYMRKGMSRYEIKQILEEKIESEPDLKYYLDNCLLYTSRCV